MSSHKLFLSYNHADSQAVHRVCELLKARGVATFLDRDDLVPGQSWPAALEEALGEAGAVAVFVGRDGFGKWQKREMHFALDRQARSEDTETPLPVIPVLLPGADPKAGFLFLNTWVDLRRDVEDVDGLEALARSATGRVAEASIERVVTFCPYRGLRAFEEEDAPFFFGRESLSERLLDTVLRESFVAVVGPSGSGKSSLVKAGLVPLLRRRRPPEPTWDIVSFRPGDRPFHRLAGALVPELEPGLSEVDRLRAIEKLGTALEKGELRLQDVVDRVLDKSGGTDRLLLLVDQFEELFTLTELEEARKALVRMLLAAVATAPVQVILTLRADFYSNALGLDRDLSDQLERAQVNVGPMRREELQWAIEEPARRVGLQLESGLVGRILDDLAAEPGSLPLLEFTLTELWERRRDGALTHPAYEEIGEVSGAIAQRAETEFERLSDDDQQAARRLFIRLVRVARPEEGSEDTRRRAALTELGSSERTVVDVLAGPDARLLVTGLDEATGEETVEIAHEALIRKWPRLRGWLDDDREFLLWRQRLRTSMAEWQRTGRDSGALLRGAPLAEAERWLSDRPAELSEEGQRYLKASIAAREGEKRREELRRRWLATGSIAAVALLLIVTTVIAVLYFRAERRAEQLWASSIVDRAEGSSDPLIATLLLQEVDRVLDRGAPPARWIVVAREVAEAPVPLAVLEGHRGPVRSAEFSYDGSRVVTASWDDTARVWSADGTGDPVVLEGHEQPVMSAAVSHDSSRVVTASWDGTARIWNADGTGEPVVLKGHEDWVVSAAFNHNDSKVVTASTDGTARIWNADGSGEPIVLKGLGRPGLEGGAAFSHDGTRLLTVSWGDTARIWNADGTGEPVVLADHVVSAAFNHDDSKVVTASADGTARVWNADGSGVPIVLAGHKRRLVSAAFNHDGSKVVTASADGTARIWNADGSGEPVVLKGHGGSVVSAVFNYNGTKAVTASADGTARIWNADGSGVTVVLKGHDGVVMSAAFNHDGSKVLTTSPDDVRVWRAAGSGVTVVLKGHQGPVTNAAFNHDGSKVLTTSRDEARVWRADGSGKPVVLRGREGSVLGAAFNDNGRRVVTISLDGTARVWRADGIGKPVVFRGHEGSVSGAAFNRDGSKVLTTSRDDVRVWRTDGTGVAVELKGADEPVTNAAFNHDGSKVVTTSLTAQVWNADSPGKPVLLKGPERPVTSAAFNHDGSKVVTASADGTARVWNTDGSGEPVVLEGHEETVTSAAFNHDGSKVVTASADGTSRVWNADGSGEPVVLKGHEGPVMDATFNHDGSKVLTTSRDDARVWNTDGSGEPIVLEGHEGPLERAAFSYDGSKVVTASVDGTARVWNIHGWAALLEILRGSTTACLSADQRRQYLGETSEVARNRFEECERSYGRVP